MASILIIDDEPGVRAFLRVAIEGFGHNVREAGNGLEGLKQYRQQPADLVLCDLCMPGTSGLDTLQAIRKEFPLARVVSMSGGDRNGHTDVLDAAKRLGAVMALQKPIGLADLLHAVGEALRSPSASTGVQDHGQANA